VGCYPMGEDYVAVCLGRRRKVYSSFINTANRMRIEVPVAVGGRST
jgi:hypothetical protein